MTFAALALVLFLVETNGAGAPGNPRQPTPPRRAAPVTRPGPLRAPVGAEPLFTHAAIDAVVREMTFYEPRTASGQEMETVSTRYQDGVLFHEVTVSAWRNEGLLEPDLEPLKRSKTLTGFGVPRGGRAGSPSFDPVTGEYWWE